MRNHVPITMRNYVSITVRNHVSITERPRILRSISGSLIAPQRSLDELGEREGPKEVRKIPTDEYLWVLMSYDYSSLSIADANDDK